MPLFGQTGPEYDKNKRRAKELKKGDKSDRKERRKERRQIRKLSKAERELVLKTAAKDRVKEIISRSGKIIGVNAIKQIPEYKRRLQNGKCIFCGEPPEKRGHICDACKDQIREMPSAHEIKLTNKTSGLGKGIPDGQNVNGIVYCKNGHRAMYYEVHGKWDCSSGCNS